MWKLGVSWLVRLEPSVVGSAAANSWYCPLRALPDNVEFLVVNGSGMEGEGTQRKVEFR